jgi:small Trp-rich protein
MYLFIIAAIIVLLKLLDVSPVGSWSWIWVLAPFALLFFWWEFLSKWMGWDTKAAERKMREDEKKAKETKKQSRGF